MYGYDVESIDDPCITNADRSITLGVQLLFPGATLINIFPILASVPVWFPGASSHKIAAEVKRLTDEVVRFPMDWAKLRMVCHLAVLVLFRALTVEPRAKGQLSHPLLLISWKRRIRSARRLKKRVQSQILLIRFTVVSILQMF